MKTLTRTPLAFGLGCCLALGAGTAAANPPLILAQTNTLAPHAVLKEKDMRFIESAASGGMFEVDASKLAEERSSDPQIKGFAEHMVTDHSKVGDELKSIASTKGVTLPTALAPKHQKMLDHLKAAKPGKDFDEDYADAMVTSHKETVALFAAAKTDVADTDLRSFASTTLPTLQQHTEMAKALEKKH